MGGTGSSVFDEAGLVAVTSGDVQSMKRCRYSPLVLMMAR